MNTKDICFFPAHIMLDMIAKKEISALELLLAHIDRIETVNQKINAIVTLDLERAREIALAIDDRLSKNEPFRTLEALPIAHKDLVLTNGIRTTFGSPIYENLIPDQDSLIVTRLKEAGAVTLGKTNTPEFGAGSQTFNTIFGVTSNPYDLEKTCGGSSGGAAAAVAAGLIPIADGSDLGGSLRNPASFCNVVGLRPSTGRVPTWPSMSAWFPLSVLGPMARTVKDVALVMSSIAGPDNRCPISLQENPQIFKASLERDFQGVRVAWSKNLGGLPVASEVSKVLDSVVGKFTDVGCVVEEVDPDLNEADEIFHTLRAWHMESSFGELFKEHPDKFKDTLVWNIEQGQLLSGADVARAERLRTKLFERLSRFMSTYEFIISPVTQVLPFDKKLPYVTEINGEKLSNYLEWMKSCIRISATGHPALSLPAGFSDSGLPVGIQITGRYRRDFDVLQLGHAIEQITGYWKNKPVI